MYEMLMLAADDVAQAEVFDPAIMPMITSMVVFLAAFGILSVLVWPKISKGLEDRESKIRDEIAAAERARKEAQKAQQQYEASVAEQRSQLEGEMAKARADVQKYRDELRSQAETQANELKQRAVKDIEAAKSAAIVDLHTEAATLAAAIAGKILKREITADDQQQLVEESLRELASVNGR